MKRDSLRLGIQQRVLAPYRAPFFDMLAEALPGGVSVFAGQPRPEEALGDPVDLQQAGFFPARNRHLLEKQFSMLWQGGLLQWLEEWDPHVLILEANARYLRQAEAVRWMKRRGRRVIGWGLGSGPTGSLQGWLRRRLVLSFDAVLTYSSQGAREYISLGMEPGRVFTAPNAAARRPAAAPPQRLPAFEDGRAVVLFVGRLQERKRVDLLLQACAALPPQVQPHVWIAGDGPARGALEAHARQVYPAAVFHGARYGADLEALFARADLFVLPGTGGLAVQQAAAAALPLMVAEADGTQADLVTPASGWLLPPGDLEALTAALLEALSDPARLRRMGLEAYRIAAEEINLERMMQVFLQAIQPGDRP